MEIKMVIELSLCLPSHHVGPMPTLVVSPDNPLTVIPQRREGRKDRVLERVCKGLQPLCCAAWGPPSVLMVRGVTT